jgi:predicted Zn-dependent peptidase
MCNINESSKCSVALTFARGHLNETKLGVASVFESIVQRAADEKIISMYGGSFTSFFTGMERLELKERMTKLYEWCVDLQITQAMLDEAVADIVRHTLDLAPLPKRQAKLIYKHTAFAKNKVAWNTTEYITALKSLTVKDVEEYRAAGLVGHNMVIVFSGAQALAEDFVNLATFLFKDLPQGRRMKVDNLLYTGGYQVVKGEGSRIMMLGWDISNIRSRVELNLLMSMLSSRLERAFAHLPAAPEVKVAGYYGFNTLRLSFECNVASRFDECVNILCSNIRRVCAERASDRRMETTRQRAMTERLLEASKAQPTAVRLAWQLLGRDVFYSADDWINEVWQVDAYDVQDTAREVFSSELTCVVYTDDLTTAPSLEEIKLKLSY